MLCTLLTGENQRLLRAQCSLNRFLHESWGNKLPKFTRAVLIFQVVEHCLRAPQLLPFQILSRFVCKAYSARTQLYSGIYIHQNKYCLLNIIFYIMLYIRYIIL